MRRWEADGKVPGLGVLILPSGVRTWYLRYHYASMAVSAGLSLQQIGGLLGHASPITTARYAHLVDHAASAAAALVAAQIKSPG